MKNMLRVAALGVCAALLCACATRTEVFSTDLTTQNGVYVLGYTSDESIRVAMEDQAVADLAAQGIAAWASHEDLPRLQRSSAGDVIAAASRRQAVGVVLINQAAAGPGDAPQTPQAPVTPLHPDLRTFFRESSTELDDSANAGGPVFAEVNLYLVDGTATRLFWNGTTWSFLADGQGTAIRDISETIAAQLQDARSEFLRNSARAENR
ncbi:MAG: hypothetical protein V2I63_08085 [Pseudomonadales bacterium]|jgi:hypothetical protein|nr:hypothetical protein [Pseudomonadales bacterium]